MTSSPPFRSIFFAIAFVLVLDLYWAPKSTAADDAPPAAGTYTNINTQAILPAAGQDGLLFISRDHALAFYEPSSGQVQKLTEPFTGQEFSVSPDGRVILFGNQILSLQSQAGGNVSASVSMTSNHGELFKLNWSPDGKEYGYVEQDGSTWIENLLGNREQLYKSDSPPDWSFDGRWMAYCDQRGRLWIAETGKPADWIARQESCTVNWSPKRSVLAYVMYPAGSGESLGNGIAYLYNPVTGRTKEIARSVSRLDWSPNGKLVSVTRDLSSGAGIPSYSITIINPETGLEQFLNEYSSAADQVPSWIEQKNGYLLGEYRFQTDLLTKEIVADHLIDATLNGNKLLVSNRDNAALDVLCQDEEANRIFPLLHLTQQDMYLTRLAGKFTPDGNWLWIKSFVGEKPVYRLARCDSAAPLLLPGGDQGADPYFSLDSSWLVIEQTHAVREELAYIAVLELDSRQIVEIPAGLDTHSIWFQMPGSAMPPVSPISSATLPSQSARTTTAIENNPVELQNSAAKRVRPLVFLPLFLWAGALVAVVSFVIYRWKYPWK